VRLLVEHLRRYVALPEDLRAVRELLDDVGIEVKRLDPDPAGHALTLELLANRGDHHCYAGVAREAAARLDTPLTLPAYARLSPSAAGPEIEVASELCLVYTATLLEHSAAAESSLPPDLSAILKVAGWDSGNAVVDASNLANLEFGQPTHAFDADRIRGRLRVRNSRQGERAWLLFTREPIELPAGLCVIADDEKILAVAGVIGCEESKTTAETRRVLLESATFEPTSVRRAARALAINTDAAARFMRGADPELPLIGAGRVIELLRPLGWSARATSCAGTWRNPERRIALNVERAARYTGYPFDAGDVVRRLERYGFAARGEASPMRVEVQVPAARLWDVHDETDLCEELCRSVGYNALAIELPPVGRGSSPSAVEQAKHKLDELLVANGFFEVFTDAFYSQPDRASLQIGEDDPLWPHVEVLNALDRDYALLKNNALIHALHTAATNLRVGHEQVKAYEWTRTFHLDPSADNGVCRERALLWGVVNGLERAPSWGDKPRPADVFYLKGLFEELRLLLRVPLQIVAVERHPLREFLHPKRACEIRLRERCVGVFGEVHARLLQAFKIKNARPGYFELDASVLHEPPQPLSYQPPPSVAPIRRNLSFETPQGITARELMATMRAAAPPWLERVEVSDYFEGKQQDRALRVLTFDLAFEAQTAARSSEEVNEICDSIVRALEAAWGAKGVRLRR
jgi:phenylalanyl-tRNA synthetase beta chain